MKRLLAKSLLLSLRTGILPLFDIAESVRVALRWDTPSQPGKGYLPAIGPQRTLYTNFYNPYVVRREGTVFTGVSLFMWGDTPSPLHNISTGPMSFLEGTPTLHPIILPLIPCPLWGSTPSESHNTSTGPWSLPHPGVPPDQRWVTPRREIAQQSQQLLRGGRYASYVHAGGLSC